MSNALAAAESVIGSAPPQRDLLGRLLDGFVAKGRLAPPDERHTARSTVTRLVAMDVDRTLIEGQSQSYLGRGLRRAGLLPWRMYIRMLWWFLLHHSFGWRPANPTRLQRIALNYLAGIPIDRLLPVFHEVVEREILPRVRPAALAEMRRWQDDGALVFLVSASVEPLIGLLALALRADGVIATKIRDGGAVFSGELDGEMVAGPMKWQRLTEAADALFRAWRLEAAYGDDDTDLALLSQAKRAFPVNPTAGLRSAAIERGWTILDWAVRATGESGSRRG
jgi:phosphoserine phosphatase